MYHTPVLSTEAIDALKVKKGGKYIDTTLGDGGHTLEILKLGGKVLGLDLDEGSLERAQQRISDAGFKQNFTGVLGNFKYIDKLAAENGFSEVGGVLYDLGYSSTQLQDDLMGLSFSKDQPLDMRLDKTLTVTAADLVNALPKIELERLFREYGEERLAKKFAEAIVSARGLKKIESTKELADILVGVASPGYERGRIHPATRVFQALRLGVNLELENLELSLPRAARLLLPGGRMVVISFHSLEDRIVKQFGLGVQSAKGELSMEIVTPKPVTSGAGEVAQNPLARSAKMRVFERI